MRRRSRSDKAERWQSWYKSRRWRKLRDEQLRRHPMCECPHCRGRRLEADTVDHHVPHRGRSRMFWDRRNLRSMNHDCHDRLKQSQERGGHGFLRGHDEHGWPLSKEHEWNDHERV